MNEPLKPGEGELEHQRGRDCCHMVHARLSSSAGRINSGPEWGHGRHTCSKLGRIKRKEVERSPRNVFSRNP